MDIQSTIRAYQNELAKWAFPKPVSFPEDFAQKRFLKKMQVPNVDLEESLTVKAWADFLKGDNLLPDQIHLPSSEWYKARQLIHEWIRGDWRESPIDFPKGSSVTPTKGLNSVESRLARGAWTTTPENFNEFAKVVYGHKALKRAFRKRYDKWYRKQNFDLTRRQSDSLMWKRLRDPFKVFSWKLERIVRFVRGSRFATVPKNNEQRRPINLEAFGNILIQRQQGLFLKKCLRDAIGVDIDTLQTLHRERISKQVATIDLKDASGNISVALCRFLLPTGFFKHLMASRSFLILGGDGEYHVPKKISSMGCGFTFELMTVILTALSRSLDPEATVFGDDIIISPEHAPRLITLLQEVGLVVNRDKSFIEGPFRESCGGNYHDDHGYVESFDFKYPETIADCCLIFNKTEILKHYPSFLALNKRLRRLTPRALQGGPLTMEVKGALESFNWTTSEYDIPMYFAMGNLSENKSKAVAAYARELHYDLRDVGEFEGFRYVPEVASRTIRDLNAQWHWGKYEMYLSSGRVCDDVLTQSGSWVPTKYVRFGRNCQRKTSLGLRARE